MNSDSSTQVKDPVCGKEVDTLRARAVGIFGGVTYYFCSADCKSKFNDPRKTPREAAPAPASSSGKDKGPSAKDKATAKEKSLKVAVPAPAPVADEPAAEEVRYAKTRSRREPEPAVPSDPSPSIEAEVAAVKGSGRAWLVVFLLFACAGAVLFFALRR
jgi:YHS domain-containing protein